MVILFGSNALKTVKDLYRDLDGSDEGFTKAEKDLSKRIGKAKHESTAVNEIKEPGAVGKALNGLSMAGKAAGILTILVDNNVAQYFPSDYLPVNKDLNFKPLIVRAPETPKTPAHDIPSNILAGMNGIKQQPLDSRAKSSSVSPAITSVATTSPPGRFH